MNDVHLQFRLSPDSTRRGVLGSSEALAPGWSDRENTQKRMMPAMTRRPMTATAALPIVNSARGVGMICTEEA